MFLSNWFPASLDLVWISWGIFSDFNFFDQKIGWSKNSFQDEFTLRQFNKLSLSKSWNISLKMCWSPGIFVIFSILILICYSNTQETTEHMNHSIFFLRFNLYDIDYRRFKCLSFFVICNCHFNFLVNPLRNSKKFTKKGRHMIWQGFKNTIIAQLFCYIIIILFLKPTNLIFFIRFL